MDEGENRPLRPPTDFEISAAQEAHSLYVDIPGGPKLLSDDILGGPLLTSMEEKAQLEAETVVDALTGINNEKGLNVNLERMLHEISRDGNKDGLLIFKVDVRLFKIFNELFGWENGNECLKDLSMMLAGNHEPGAVRFEDVVARLGGDDFVVVLKLAEELFLNEKNQMLESFRDHSIVKRLLDVGSKLHKKMAQQYQEDFDREVINDRDKVLKALRFPIPYEGDLDWKDLGVAALNIGGLIMRGEEAEFLLKQYSKIKRAEDKTALWNKIISPLMDIPSHNVKNINSSSSRLTVCNREGQECFSAVGVL